MRKFLNQMLIAAISKDNVKMAYRLVRLGADVNHKFLYTWEEWVGDGGSPERGSYETRKRYETPLYFAKSEAMKQVLKHLGGVSGEELRPIWKQELKEKNELEAERQKQAEDRRNNRNITFAKKILKKP